MARIKCPECGRETVLDAAERCPGCGYGIRAHMERIRSSQAEEKHRAEEVEKKNEMLQRLLELR